MSCPPGHPLWGQHGRDSVQSWDRLGKVDDTLATGPPRRPRPHAGLNVASLGDTLEHRLAWGLEASPGGPFPVSTQAGSYQLCGLSGVLVSQTRPAKCLLPLAVGSGPVPQEGCVSEPQCQPFAKLTEAVVGTPILSWLCDAAGSLLGAGAGQARLAGQAGRQTGRAQVVWWHHLCASQQRELSDKKQIQNSLHFTQS